jgi:hypothetical protein
MYNQVTRVGRVRAKAAVRRPPLAPPVASKRGGREWQLQRIIANWVSEAAAAGGASFRFEVMRYPF